MTSTSGLLVLGMSLFLYLENQSNAFAFAFAYNNGCSSQLRFREISVEDDVVVVVDSRNELHKAINIPSSTTAPLLRLAPDLDTLVTLATFADPLADAARKEIIPYWRQGQQVFGQQIKVEEGQSVFQLALPCTLADRAAERVMRTLITATYPEHGI